MRIISSLCLSLTIVTTAAAQGGPPPPPPPAGNAITPQKIQLGKALFWDEQLSSTGTSACASCHIPTAGGSDPRTVGGPASTNPGPDGDFGTPDDIFGSPGVPKSEADGSYILDEFFGLRPQVTGRKSPTMINAAYSPNVLFWDGRADGSFEDPITGVTLLATRAALENQAAGPPTSDVEMAHFGADWSAVVARIEAVTPLALASDLPGDLAAFINGRTYPQLFADAFGTPGVSAARICMAIATYERTLIAVDAPFDAFIAGQPGALTQQEAQGFQIFTGPGRCIVCHGGPLFTDNNFHYTGVRPPGEDLGRFLIDNDPGHRGSFKTPTLRNVELRAPFFHNGRFASLEEVVAFYNRGGDFDAPNKAPAVAPIGLNAQQRAALVAFLRRPLTDPRVQDGSPPFDGPTLYGQSTNQPTFYGVPTAGTGGFVPNIVAIEPPKLGNTNMTVAVEGGLGGAPALFAVDLVADEQGTLFYGARLHLARTGALHLYRAGTLDGVGPGNGYESVMLDVPNDPTLLGTSLFGQWVILDAGAPGRFSMSRGVRFNWF